MSEKLNATVPLTDEKAMRAAEKLAEHRVIVDKDLGARWWSGDIELSVGKTPWATVTAVGPLAAKVVEAVRPVPRWRRIGREAMEIAGVIASWEIAGVVFRWALESLGG